MGIATDLLGAYPAHIARKSLSQALDSPRTHHEALKAARILRSGLIIRLSLRIPRSPRVGCDRVSTLSQ